MCSYLVDSAVNCGVQDAWDEQWLDVWRLDVELAGNEADFDASVRFDELDQNL